MGALLSLLPVFSELLDRVLPDKGAADAAKLELVKLAQAGDLAQLQAGVTLATNQADINKVEAASSSLFVAGWRPFMGWTCGMAFAFKFIGGPMLVLLSNYLGHPVTLPVMDFTEMSTILLGMLGIGTLRTVEKVKGVA